MNYLMVMPVPFFRIDDRHVALESAFANHLIRLKRELGPDVGRFSIAAPVYGRDEYERRRESLIPFDWEKEGFEFEALHQRPFGRMKYLLTLPRLLVRLWRAVGRADVVHAGPSEIYFPREIVSMLIASLRGKRTVFVVDIDWRESAGMNLKTGTWSFGEYWRRKYIHNSWRSMQVHWAARACSLVLLKGRDLARDYGRGNPRVHYFLNAVHSGEMILPESELERKAKGLAEDARPLKAVYFGRLTAYKGIDRMLEAVAMARREGVDVRFDIIGGGESEASLREVSRKLDLESHVRFHGPQPYGPEFFTLLQKYDLLLAAPLSQDTPRSALDAQANGIPVLAYETSYYRELQADGAGVVCVPWNDTEAMARALVRFARRRAELEPLVRKSVEFAARNTQDAWLKKRVRWTHEGMARTGR